MASAGYTTSRHSQITKEFGAQMDALKDDEEKALIFGVLSPVKRMNEHIFELTSEYHEMIENVQSFAFLNQLEIFIANVVKILNNEAIYANSTADKQSATDKSTTSTDTETSATDTDTQVSHTKADDISLPELIAVLMATDNVPIQYNGDLLVTQLINNKITATNVLNEKQKMTSILTDCGFPQNRAEFTMRMIEQNVSAQAAAAAAAQPPVLTGPLPQPQSSYHHNPATNTCLDVMHHGGGGSNHHASTLHNSGAGAIDDEEMMATEDPVESNNLVDLTVMAMETVRQIYVHRPDVVNAYKQNDIDTARLLLMTENEFASLLQASTPAYTTQNCVEVLKLVKTWMNVPQKFRFDIDVALAVIYLVNEGHLFVPKEMTVKPQRVMNAFANSSAKEVLKTGRKQFIKKLQSDTALKGGHCMKVWNALKTLIQDGNVEVPPQILNKDYVDSEDEQEQEQTEAPAPAAAGGSGSGSNDSGDVVEESEVVEVVQTGKDAQEQNAVDEAAATEMVDIMNGQAADIAVTNISEAVSV
eukprot:CAMPEP_0202694600 /NCGR_PEP_ID=MMETSP1385-20130828/8416_1 /ASSEMBLY_ACC=CAM_ASM_000861 /TAXON_ID=933848 /ORGANISM="Elphidium margaritaceum" /LENGTH=530 /DNA_ID=CAMNT_0049350473 /DNA_START=21 /DNA_END=1613 /DNA_ORIENTATION=+